MIGVLLFADETTTQEASDVASGVGGVLSDVGDTLSSFMPNLIPIVGSVVLALVGVKLFRRFVG